MLAEKRACSALDGELKKPAMYSRFRQSLSI